jgi:hypothetical protein
MKVFIQYWEESERGWGTRPDGYSLHITCAEAKAYADKAMKDQEAYFLSRGVKGVPDEYSRPYGEPKEVDIKGNTKKAREVKAKKSVRYYDQIKVINQLIVP